MTLITRDEIAKLIRPALGALGERPAGYALLGKGDRSGIIIKDAEHRQVYYYSEGQPTAFAPLSLNMSLVAINNPQMEGWRVRLGYPNYRPDVLHILGIDAVAGVAAGGGYTPDEQYNAKAQFLDVGSFLNFRLSPNNPADLSVFVSAGYYYDSSGNLAFFGGDLYDLTDAIGALSSGQHQLAVVSLDVSTGELALATNTAETGGSGDKDAFNESTIVGLTYGDNDQQKGAVHLYYGQTAVGESDIYRQGDPRVPFTRPGAAGGGGIDYFPISLTTTLTIPTNKQVVTGSFTIGTGGILTVNGKITIV